MEQEKAGFRELEHTADWELEVWAADLVSLLEQAARGMYALSGTRLKPEPRLSHHFTVQAADQEGLLVSFLSELLFSGEQKGAGFDQFDLKLDGNRLEASVEGGLIAEQEKEIKAVTYHNLKVHQGTQGWRVRVVFDV